MAIMIGIIMGIMENTVCFNCGRWNLENYHGSECWIMKDADAFVWSNRQKIELDEILLE